MKKQTSITAALVAASVLLAAGNLMAADESTGQSMPNNNSPSANLGANHEMRASDLIGKSIKNDQNQTVCEIKDLVVNVDSGRAQYAIVHCGGMAGVGGKRIALPLNAIQFGSDGALTISATKEELENASATPTGSWASATGQEWAHGIDGYYGQPQNNQFERESAQPFNSGREPVRNDANSTVPGSGRNDELPSGSQQQVTPNNASSDMSPTQDSLQNTVNQAIQQSYGSDISNGVHVNVNNGVVTLTGTVSSQSTKDSLESKVQSLPGVQRVDDQLTVQNQ